MNLMFANDVVWATWRFTAYELLPNLRHTNQVIGVYVTAGARINLYRYLDRFQQKAFYCDTDSIIFFQQRDEPELVETGDKLGAMTSELKLGEYIAEFVSGGPKNYAYRIIDSKADAK